MDARMLMPALISSMPVPSYSNMLWLLIITFMETEEFLFLLTVIALTTLKSVCVFTINVMGSTRVRKNHPNVPLGVYKFVITKVIVGTLCYVFAL